MSQLHILIIPSWYPTINNNLSGIFFKEQAESLAKHNINIGCIAINELSARSIFKKNKIKFDYLDSSINNVNTMSVLYPMVNRFNATRKVIRIIVFKYMFKQYIKKYGVPNLIHLHSFLYGDLAMWIKENYNINYIVTEHSSGFLRNLYNNKEINYAKNVFYKASYNIAVSQDFKKLLEIKFQTTFHYVPNTIDTNFFNFKNNVNASNSFSFINVAFLNKNKNQALLIEAFSTAFRGNANVSLTIVGDGEEYHNLRGLIKSLNMQNQITLHGVASREEVLELLQDANAFVLSSQYETFGIVMIEAMSCGLPVVATKCGGSESIVINDKLGILVDKGIKDLAEGMLTLYNSTYNKEYIRSYVIKNFSSEVIAKKIIDAYRLIYEKQSL